MQFPLYALPASAALIAKAAILVYAWRSKVRSPATRLCLLFIACMTVQSVAEVSIFVIRSYGWMAGQQIAGRWWYSATILGIALLLHLSIVTSISRYSTRLPISCIAAIYVPIVSLQALLWRTSLLIAGFQPMAYTITKIAGPYYFLIEFQSIAYLLVAVCLLAFGACKQLSSVRRLRSKLLLLGLLPFGGLIIAVLILLHFGYQSFNVTVTGPIALIFFLTTATYALHQHRLVDISYYLPGSKVRRQKVEFYERVRQTSREIAGTRSADEMLNRVADLMHCRVALVGGPSIMVAVSEDDDLLIDDYTPSEFPREQLQKVDRILAADELAEVNPVLYQLMKRYKVGAIVPLNIAGLPTHWLLLGERFQKHVYTSRDFKIVEALFDRIGACFLENVFVLQSYVSESKKDVIRLGEQLATAHAEIEVIQQKLAAIESANRTLRDENARWRRSALHVVEPNLVSAVLSGQMTLEEYLTEREKQLVAAALRSCNSEAEAAALLGTTEATLRSVMNRFRLEIDQEE